MTGTKTAALHLPTGKKSLLAAKKLAAKSAKNQTVRAHSDTKKLAQKLAPQKTNEVFKAPRKFKPRTQALRAIRRLQSRSDRVCGVPMANMQRLVVNEITQLVTDVRMGSGVVQGIRDVTEHFLHEILKSARRLTQEQTHKAWTITGRSVQSAAARWAKSNPYFLDFLDAYTDVRQELLLPTLEAKTDCAESGLLARLAKREDAADASVKKPAKPAKAEAIAEGKDVKTEDKVPTDSTADAADDEGADADEENSSDETTDADGDAVVD